MRESVKGNNFVSHEIFSFFLCVSLHLCIGIIKEGLQLLCVNLFRICDILFFLAVLVSLQVQNLIERCLQLYMNQKEVVDTLLEQAKIEPGFTELGNLHTSWIFLNLIG